MKSATHSFSGKEVNYYFDADLNHLQQIVPAKTILVTDENVFKLFEAKFAGWKTIVISAGEEHKQQSTVNHIIEELIKVEADRNSFVVGIGGGVITDMVGYAAGIYMRGIKVGFLPTSILGMVDASVGGKNGVDVGLYKNLVGLIRQPEFLLFDYSFTEKLPQAEWINGFAEIIKHAAIKDEAMFSLLEEETLESFQQSNEKLAALIERNVNIKTKVVEEDEFEQGDRKLLNFGHTIGHAIENIYNLPHGHAISIGMVAATTISEEMNGFASVEKQRLIDLLSKYHLPVSIKADHKKVWELLKMDKKRTSDKMNFVLLDTIGKAVVVPVPLVQLEQLISNVL